MVNAGCFNLENRISSKLTPDLQNPFAVRFYHRNDEHGEEEEEKKNRWSTKRGDFGRGGGLTCVIESRKKEWIDQIMD